MAAGSRFGWPIPTAIGLCLGALAGACAPTVQKLAPLPLAGEVGPAAPGAGEQSIVSERQLSTHPTASLMEENVTPAATSMPSLAGSPSADVSSSPTEQTLITPEPSPTEVPPALEVGSVAPQGQISDGPLDSVIASAQPARAASLRVVEQARAELKAGKADAAIRIMAKAISIDPTNPYAYFYLGQANFVKKDYAQAAVFFSRAENGFLKDPAWVSETIGYKGASYEFAGRDAEAAAAYKQALDFAPGNLMAAAGFSRVQASLPQPSGSGTPLVVSPPGGAVPGPPEVAPPSAAPAANPPAAAPDPNH
ncbi:MAG TPA: tetratricopeptide repeat protein [Candidatus Binataceae bacterium]